MSSGKNTVETKVKNLVLQIEALKAVLNDDADKLLFNQESIQKTIEKIEKALTGQGEGAISKEEFTQSIPIGTSGKKTTVYLALNAALDLTNTDNSLLNSIFPAIQKALSHAVKGEKDTVTEILIGNTSTLGGIAGMVSAWIERAQKKTVQENATKLNANNQTAESSPLLTTPDSSENVENRSPNTVLGSTSDTVRKTTNSPPAPSLAAVHTATPKAVSASSTKVAEVAKTLNLDLSDVKFKDAMTQKKADEAAREQKEKDKATEKENLSEEAQKKAALAKIQNIGAVHPTQLTMNPNAHGILSKPRSPSASTPPSAKPETKEANIPAQITAVAQLAQNLRQLEELSEQVSKASGTEITPLLEKISTIKLSITTNIQTVSKANIPGLKLAKNTKDISDVNLVPIKDNTQLQTAYTDINTHTKAIINTLLDNLINKDVQDKDKVKVAEQLTTELRKLKGLETTTIVAKDLQRGNDAANPYAAFYTVVVSKAPGVAASVVASNSKPEEKSPTNQGPNNNKEKYLVEQAMQDNLASFTATTTRNSSSLSSAASASSSLTSANSSPIDTKRPEGEATVAATTPPAIPVAPLPVVAPTSGTLSPISEQTSNGAGPVAAPVAAPTPAPTPVNNEAKGIVRSPLEQAISGFFNNLIKLDDTIKKAAKENANQNLYDIAFQHLQNQNTDNRWDTIITNFFVEVEKDAKEKNKPLDNYISHYTKEMYQLLEVRDSQKPHPQLITVMSTVKGVFDLTLNAMKSRNTPSKESVLQAFNGAITAKFKGLVTSASEVKSAIPIQSTFPAATALKPNTNNTSSLSLPLTLVSDLRDNNLSPQSKPSSLATKSSSITFSGVNTTTARKASQPSGSTPPSQPIPKPNTVELATIQPNSSTPPAAPTLAPVAALSAVAPTPVASGTNTNANTPTVNTETKENKIPQPLTATVASPTATTPVTSSTVHPSASPGILERPPVQKVKKTGEVELTSIPESDKELSVTESIDDNDDSPLLQSEEVPSEVELVPLFQGLEDNKTNEDKETAPLLTGTNSSSETSNPAKVQSGTKEKVTTTATTAFRDKLTELAGVISRPEKDIPRGQTVYTLVATHFRNNKEGWKKAIKALPKVDYWPSSSAKEVLEPLQKEISSLLPMPEDANSDKGIVISGLQGMFTEFLNKRGTFFNTTNSTEYFDKFVKALDKAAGTTNPTVALEKMFQGFSHPAPAKAAETGAIKPTSALKESKETNTAPSPAAQSLAVKAASARELKSKVEEETRAPNSSSIPSSAVTGLKSINSDIPSNTGAIASSLTAAAPSPTTANFLGTAASSSEKEDGNKPAMVTETPPITTMQPQQRKPNNDTSLNTNGTKEERNSLEDDEEAQEDVVVDPEDPRPQLMLDYFKYLEQQTKETLEAIEQKLVNIIYAELKKQQDAQTVTLDDARFTNIVKVLKNSSFENIVTELESEDLEAIATKLEHNKNYQELLEEHKNNTAFLNDMRETIAFLNDEELEKSEELSREAREDNLFKYVVRSIGDKIKHPNPNETLDESELAILRELASDTTEKTKFEKTWQINLNAILETNSPQQNMVTTSDSLSTEPVAGMSRETGQFSDEASEEKASSEEDEENHTPTKPPVASKSAPIAAPVVPVPSSMPQATNRVVSNQPQQPPAPQSAATVTTKSKPASPTVAAKKPSTQQTTETEEEEEELPNHSTSSYY